MAGFVALNFCIFPCGLLLRFSNLVKARECQRVSTSHNAALHSATSGFSAVQHQLVREMQQTSRTPTKTTTKKMDYLLSVQAPWAEMLLTGTKTVETRAYPFPEELLRDVWLFLVEIANHNNLKLDRNQAMREVRTGKVVGAVQITQVVEYTTHESWLADEHRHRVPDTSQFGFRQKGRPLFGWVVGKRVTFPKPYQVPHEVERYHRSLFVIKHHKGLASSLLSAVKQRTKWPKLLPPNDPRSLEITSTPRNESKICTASGQQVEIPDSIAKLFLELCALDGTPNELNNKWSMLRPQIVGELVAAAQTRVEALAAPQTEEIVAVESVSGTFQYIANTNTLQALGFFPTLRLTKQLRSGKFRYEVKVTSDTKQGVIGMFGWADSKFSAHSLHGLGVGCDDHSWSFDTRRARLFHTKGERSLENAKNSAKLRGDVLRALEKNDVLGVAIDLDTKRMWFGINGADWMEVSHEDFANFEFHDYVCPALSLTSSFQAKVNFGNKPFKFAGPEGEDFAPVHTEELDIPAMIEDNSQTIANTRRFYMRSLQEMIGARPENVEESWKEELPGLTGRELEDLLKTYAAQYQQCKGSRWNDDEAMLLVSGINYSTPLGDAISHKISKFARFTYRFYELTVTHLSPLSEANLRNGFFRPKHELIDYGDGWLKLDEPDSTGFRGFTSYQPTVVFPLDNLSWEDDKLFLNHDTNTFEVKWFKGGKKEAYDTLIHFVVSEKDDTGFHTPLTLNNHSFLFPPMTLFRVVQPEPNTPFSHLSNTRLVLSNGSEVDCKIVHVKPTFMVSPGSSEAMESGGKFSESAHVLGYGSREEYIRGIEEIVESPPLTMEQEFLRDDRWKVYMPHSKKRETFTGKQVWEYVTGTAKEEITGNGKRDADRTGWSVADFVQEAARYMAERNISPEYHLTQNEVIAIRLYSGPAFVPINSFLREVARLSSEWRRKVAHNMDFSYSSTVGFISSAIRKLSKATALESVLYRGVRGQLPASFWLKDKLGLICATDFGFMSTSLNPDTPRTYLRGVHNVLWRLHCRGEDEAYHMGADISFLSQYRDEQEVLFPPLTMLNVSKRGGGVEGEGQQGLDLEGGMENAVREFQVEKQKSERFGIEYVEIGVVPYYA